MTTLTHRYAGENLAVCGAAVPDPCPECDQPDVEALAFALPAIVGRWDAGEIDNVGAAKLCIAALDRLDR